MSSETKVMQDENESPDGNETPDENENPFENNKEQEPLEEDENTIEARTSLDNTCCWMKFFINNYIIFSTILKKCSVENFEKWFFKPTDPSSLAFSRILFGLLMFFDIVEERGLSEADLRWGDPDECRFPLFDFLEPLPLHLMCMVYLIMWLGSLGIAFGAYFKLSCIAFLIPYWYILLLDKTAWNNHSYLYGILAILFLVSDAHFCWSIDSWRGKVPKNMDIPNWNYIILRYQMFLLYFHAGIKKTDLDWLSGHSMTHLATHWVFKPFKPFLPVEIIDLYIVHRFGFLLDLTAGFLMYFDSTRPISFFFLLFFHLMNSQMFYIGMFPFVCLVTMPLFCQPDWPKIIINNLKKCNSSKCDENIKNPKCLYPKDKSDDSKHSFKNIGIVLFFTAHAFIQTFLPYSHSITKGYNNWTNGLYGYSWDMMVHSWDTNLATVKVVNHENNETIFIDPEAWVKNNKWQRHADMIVQYCRCVKNHLKESDDLKNISIYVDVWTSLNKMIYQRMFDPRVDILKADWGPFKTTKWVMPLLRNYSDWRPYVLDIEKEVRNWSAAADVIFMADFPGFTFQNYIHKGLSNVSIVSLDGAILVAVQGDQIYRMHPENSLKLPTGKFHEVRTISQSPSVFMYTFYNETKVNQPKNDPDEFNFTLFEDVYSKIDNFLNAIALVSNGFLRTFYSVPMVRRVKIPDTNREDL